MSPFQMRTTTKSEGKSNSAEDFEGRVTMMLGWGDNPARIRNENVHFESRVREKGIHQSGINQVKRTSLNGTEAEAKRCDTRQERCGMSLWPFQYTDSEISQFDSRLEHDNTEIETLTSKLEQLANTEFKTGIYSLRTNEIEKENKCRIIENH
jgi:hypothetical protein